MLADVLVRGKEQATEEVPTVLFGSGELNEYQRENDRRARRATRRRYRA